MQTAKRSSRLLAVLVLAVAAESPRFVQADPSGDGVAAPAQLSVKGTNPVADPGFEAGTPNPNWLESSTNFGTPICSIATCGAGLAPLTGDWYAWFGGFVGFEESRLSQDVLIPPGTSELTFYLQIQGCDPTGGADHFLEVLIDGVRVHRVDANSPLCGVASYSQQTVQLDPSFNTVLRTLEFHAVMTGPSITNFLVDDVALAVPAGLEAYYPFDGNAQDHSGNGRHGSLEGNWFFTPSITGTGLRLTGDAWVDIVDPVLDDAAECTLTYWIRFEDLEPGDPNDPCCNAIFAEDLFFDRSLHNNLAFFTDPDTLEWHIGGNERARIPAPTSAPTNWTHLAMAYSSTLGRSEMYVNGVLAGTQDHAAALGCGRGASSQIGAWDSGGGQSRFLNGSVDELRIYSRRLTADEITGLLRLDGYFADGFESVPMPPP